eukprot:SAG22_NODE_860_length_6828_cov_5.663100_1_plen_214_part_00
MVGGEGREVDVPLRLQPVVDVPEEPAQAPLVLTCSIESARPHARSHARTRTQTSTTEQENPGREDGITLAPSPPGVPNARPAPLSEWMATDGESVVRGRIPGCRVEAQPSSNVSIIPRVEVQKPSSATAGAPVNVAPAHRVGKGRGMISSAAAAASGFSLGVRGFSLAQHSIARHGPLGMIDTRLPWRSAQQRWTVSFIHSGVSSPTFGGGRA